MSDQDANARLEVGRAMAEAAGLLVDGLDREQRAVALVPFDAGDSPAAVERRTWFYTPADHGGLSLAAMSADQHRRTHRLLATGLSRAGYVTAATIMGLENVPEAGERIPSLAFWIDWSDTLGTSLEKVLAEARKRTGKKSGEPPARKPLL